MQANANETPDIERVVPLRAGSLTEQRAAAGAAGTSVRGRPLPAYVDNAVVGARPAGWLGRSVSGTIGLIGMVTGVSGWMLNVFP